MNHYVPPVAAPQMPMQLPIISTNAGTITFLQSKDGKRTLPVILREDTEPTVDERPFPRTCQNSHATFPLREALACKNLSQIVEYYSNWHGLYLVSDYQKSIAQTLVEVAQLPEAKVARLQKPETEPVIPFLLKRLNLDYVERIDCLYDAALDNGHIEIIQFINEHSEKPHAMMAIHEAITRNNPTRLTNLLKAGVSPDLGVGSHECSQLIVHDDVEFAAEESLNAHYPLHSAAFKGHAELVSLLLDYKANAMRLNQHKQTPFKAMLCRFTIEDSEEMTSKRLFILNALLQAMPEEARPLPYEVDLFCVHPKHCEKVLKVLRKFNPKPPARLRMIEELTPEELEKLEHTVKIGAGVCLPTCTVACICINEKCCKSIEKKEPVIAKAASIDTPKKLVNTTNRRTLGKQIKKN